jgi:hypothetical protein
VRSAGKRVLWKRHGDVLRDYYRAAFDTARIDAALDEILGWVLDRAKWSPIAYAKSNPGKINMASNGNGTAQHVVGELFKMMTGVVMVHVPYRGGAAVLADLLSARVEVFFPDAFVTWRSGALS